MALKDEMQAGPGWLTPAGECPDGPVALTATFCAGEDPTGTILEITGLGLFRAYLDGVWVGEDYLAPGCNDYAAYVRVYRYPIEGRLSPGREARLTVWLGDGWYRGRYGIDKPPDRGGCVWGDRYLLAARIIKSDGDGHESVLLSTDEPGRWTAQPVPLLSSSIYDGEVWDFTRPCSESYPCIRAGEPLPERRVPAFGAPIRRVGTRRPTRLTTPSGESVLDFGENLAGILCVRGTIPRGQTLTAELGEHMQDGNFCRDNMRSARAALIITGDGTDRIIEPLFTYCGFRYVRLSGLELGTLAELDFEMQVLSSVGDMALRFSCDRPELEALVACARRGQLSNFMDIPTDCPQRDERLGWGADAWIFAGTACWLSDCRAFYEKYLYDLRIEQTRYYAGDLPMYTPSLRGEAGTGGAGWADVGVLLPWQLYERYGEIDALSRSYPMMHDYAEQLLRREQGQGRICGAFTFGDWLAGDGMTPQSRDGGTEHDYLTNLFLWRVLTIVATAADALGHTADCQRYEKASARVKRAFLHEYFTPSGRLCIDTQTAYVLSLAFGLYPAREAVVKGLRHRLERDGWVIKTGFLGTPFLLPLLFDCGEDAGAYRILLRKDPPGWLYELSQGATTFWERWDSVLPNGHFSGTGMNSLNHYAHGSVCETLVSRIAGLRPLSPGFERVCIRPHPGAYLHKLDLTFASMRGNFDVRWRVDHEGRVELWGQLPEGVVATVILPDGQTHPGVQGRFRYRSGRLPHLVHPLGPDALLYDILADPQGAELLRRQLPQAYAILTGPEPDFLMRPLHFLSTLPFFGASETAVRRLGDELEQITTWRGEV